jgi:UDPglucose 6-dehydrogenase
MKNIVVIGSGYVGTTTAAVLANCGNNVVAIDIDRKKVDLINSGKAPFFEAGLNKLIEKAIKDKSLSATVSYGSIKNADIVFSCVGTPDNPDGSSNLQYIFDSAQKASIYMQNNCIYVQKSTVPVGTGEKVETIFTKAGKTIHYVSNPEFLREGSAISDTLWFDRIVAGGDNKLAINEVLDLYRSVEKCRNNITKISGIKKQVFLGGQYISTNRNSAELIKVTSNAFLALKISFANSIAKLADQTNADINEIMDAVGADRRIGRAFLNAGRGYGGGCFPKDVTGLISSATEYGVDLGIMTATADLNETMPGYIANKAKDILGSLADKKVAVLGLAFKAGTSDSRKSPGVKLANILSHDGATVRVYDPQANDEARADLLKAVILCDSMEEAVKNADAVLIATEWPEFLNLDIENLKASMLGNIFVDCMNVFPKQKINNMGFRYIGVGRGSINLSK